MPNLTIATSNLNRSLRALVTGSGREHQEFLELAGYRQGSEQNPTYRGGGFEWSETRNFNNLTGSIALQLAAVGDISALHQSWRSTRLTEILGRLGERHKSWGELFQKAVQVSRSVGTVAVIPFIDDSLDNLATIQAAMGDDRKLSVVVHPNEQQPPGERPRFAFSYLHEAKRFAELRHQPTAETLKMWGVLSKNTSQMVDDMLVRQQLYGFGGVAWNTKHAQEERHGLWIPHPYGMVAELAQRDALPEFHLNLTNDSDSLRAFLNGEDTYHSSMLTLALGAMAAEQDLYLVTKVTADDFANIGISDEVDGHRQLLEVVTDMAA